MHEGAYVRPLAGEVEEERKAPLGYANPPEEMVAGGREPAPRRECTGRECRFVVVQEIDDVVVQLLGEVRVC